MNAVDYLRKMGAQLARPAPTSPQEARARELGQLDRNLTPSEQEEFHALIMQGY